MILMKGHTRASIAVAAAALLSSGADAGETWKFGENASLTAGAGLRVVYRDFDGNSDTTLESASLHGGDSPRRSSAGPSMPTWP